jgi:VWFA-related protein
MMRPAATLALALSTWLVATGRAQERLVYRSSVDSVTVNASVRSGGTPVGDLTVEDFELRDAGTVQTLTSASYEAVPVDVTFVVDLSGSINSPLLASLTTAIDAVQTRLRPEDRAAVITFNHRIVEAQPLSRGTGDIAQLIGKPDGYTSLVDAATVALLRPAPPDRRQMIILFTDGMDTTSFTTGASLVEIAQRRETAVFSVSLFAQGNSQRRPPHEALFRALADATGSVMAVVGNRAELGDSFLKAVDEFRSSYVLRYTYDGPVRAGWHPIEIRVKRPGRFTVRARAGYLVND